MCAPNDSVPPCVVHPLLFHFYTPVLIPGASGSRRRLLVPRTGLTHARVMPSLLRAAAAIMTRGHRRATYIYMPRAITLAAHDAYVTPVQSEPFWYVCAHIAADHGGSRPPLHPKAEAIPLAHLLVHPPPFLAARGALFRVRARARSTSSSLSHITRASSFSPATHAEATYILTPALVVGTCMRARSREVASSI